MRVVKVAARTEYRRRVRYALAQLRASNGYFIFEEICFELARETISANLVRGSGPVSAGGDQGRDFETYVSSRTGQLGEIGKQLALNDPPAISYICTLQQDALKAKILSDVAKTLASGTTVELIVAYCEANIPIALRHSIIREVRDAYDCRLEIFDGSAIADLLTSRDELAETVERLLFVRFGAWDLTVPRGLPRGPLRFVNRANELATLDQLLFSRSEVSPSVVVLSGMHGVGKSALSMHWAHSRRNEFPDGDLFGDFSRRRFGATVDVGDVLDRFIRELGVDDSAVPSSIGEKQRLFQRLTVDKRLLIVLDDVEYPAQVLSALPGGGDSVVLVTTNYFLEELIFEGAVGLAVRPLEQEEAMALLSAAAGTDRLERERQAATALTAMCAGLPLTLAVSGGTLAAHPTWDIASFVERVREQPLRALSGRGDFSVDSMFDFAYSNLTPAAALVYRRVGLFPGRDFAPAVAAVLADLPLAVAGTALEELEQAHLVEQYRGGRFRLHELIRIHAKSTCELVDREETIRECRVGLVDWFYSLARAADWAVVADRLRLTKDLETDFVDEFASPAEAFSWFAAERANVMSAIYLAEVLGCDERVWQFAEALWPLCHSHKYYTEWIESQSLAVSASERLGDPCAEARVRSQLAMALAELGEADRVDEQLNRAAAAAQECGNSMLIASVTEFGGVCQLRMGNPEVAQSAFTDARQQFEACKSARGVAIQDFHLGWTAIKLGEHEQALPALERARVGLGESNDLIGVGRVLVRLGEALRVLGRFDESRELLQQAIATMERFGIKFEQAEALESLAAVSDVHDDSGYARLYRQRSYEIYRDLGHPRADELLASVGLIG